MDFSLVFLFSLAIVWIIFATISDLRTREIYNWLNLSLIVFALGFRFFYSLFSESFNFFYQGLIGLAIFWILGILLYNVKFFAGGDQKLFIALGPILPLDQGFYFNLEVFAIFLIIFLFVGAIYSLFSSFYLGLKNRKVLKKEFDLQFNKSRKLIYSLTSLSIVFLILGFFDELLFFLAILIFIMPYLYVYTKSVDESCMVKKIKVSDLTEGDWLYKDVKVGNSKVKSDWDGLTKEGISKIRKYHKHVFIRNGIPFSPVFLISMALFVYLIDTGLWNSFW